MEKFQLSVERFNQFAQEYEKRFMNMDGYKETLDKFMNLISKEKPEILELGCGPGNVTKYLKQNLPNSKILAIDLAPEMINLALKNVPDVDFILLDVRNISGIKKKFDAIVIAFCLPFLSYPDTQKLIEDTGNLLNSGGLLYISTMEGDEKDAGYEITSFTKDSKVYFNYHQEKFITNALISNGFVIEKLTKQNYYELDESVTIDMIYIAKKI